jgi:predicted phage terminase large subunit-like protein
VSQTENEKVVAVKAQLAKREMARRSLLYFTKRTLPNYQAGWVHEDICKRLERFSREVAEKKSPRLMLLMPPRHGKSELASIRFPAWHLGHYPTHEIMNVGYNMDLPMKFSRKVRDVFRDPVYQATFSNSRLDPDSQAVEAWMTTQGGGYLAAGVGGGITGKGAHCLIIDDPLKNQEEADSVERRDLLEDWFESTAYTRLAPGGGVLLIQTAWSDDDLSGRLQTKMRNDPLADQYEIVKYPALAEKYEYRVQPSLEIIRLDEPARKSSELLQDRPGQDRVELLREPGEALHPDRYDAVALSRIKANLQPRVWSALFQQNPVPDEGMYFQQSYFRTVHGLPDIRGMRLYTAWDFAITEKQTADYNVGATIAQDHNDNIYVLDVHRFRGDSFAIVEAMLNIAMRWMGTDGRADYLIGVEDGQIWRAIEPLFKRRCAERKQYPSYEPLKPFTDKLARARPLQGRMQQGRVYFPEEASWFPELRHELLRFPAGVHDDMVDALAWAIRSCLNKSPPSLEAPKKVPSWKDQLELDLNDGTWMSS